MKILNLIFLIVVIIGCGRINKDIPAELPPPIESINVIFDKDTTIQISCRVDRTLEEPEKQLYISFNSRDTFNIPIENATFFLVGSKFSLTDTLLVYPGDTLRIVQRNGDVYSTSHDKFVWPNLNNKDLDDFTIKIDSIKGIFYEYSNPIVFSNDYSSRESRQIIVKHSSIKENAVLYDRLVRMSVEQFYLERNAYEDLLVDSPKLSKLLAEKLKYKLYLELGNLYNVNNNSVALDYSSSDLFINDSLPKALHGYSYLRNYIEDVVLEGEVDWSKSKMYIDYKKAYELIPDHLTGEVLKYASQICLENMFNVGEDFTSIDNYYKRYCSEYGDTTFQRSFETRYAMNFSDLKKSSTDLNLIDNDQTAWTLTDILALNRGKLIYVDFWASWCRPCRAAMPASRKLKKSYEKKKVVFIYFSIDKNKKQWKAASRSENITTNNYLVLNNEAAQFTKDIKMSSIPRYLLFDKKGKLVHQEAPGPDGSQIHKLLDKYLAD